jgi:hypothetical protein
MVKPTRRVWGGHPLGWASSPVEAGVYSAPMSAKDATPSTDKKTTRGGGGAR